MLVNNLEVSGGYQKLVIRLSQEFLKKGHEVTIYSPRVDKEKCYPDDIKHLDIESLPTDLANNTPVGVYRSLMVKVRGDLDALIIHDELSLLGVAMLKKRPPKVVWMLNNQLPADLIRYTPEIKNVYRQTVGTLKTKLHESNKAKTRVKLLRQGVKGVTDFVTYDEFNKHLVRKILRRRAVVVSAGADLDAFKKYAKARSFSTKKQYTVLSVGVLFPHRRYEDLIGALVLLKKKNIPVKVIIVGRQDLSPDYYKSLIALARAKKVGKLMEFKNYVTDKEMVELYKTSDVFAFINDGFTWGISVFEAVAAHLPVVITNNIGAADLVKHNETGWVVKPRSPKEVAKSIEDIVVHRHKAQKTAERADKDLTPIVSWDAYTERMLKVMTSSENY